MTDAVALLAGGTHDGDSRVLAGGTHDGDSRVLAVPVPAQLVIPDQRTSVIRRGPDGFRVVVLIAETYALTTGNPAGRGPFTYQAVSRSPQWDPALVLPATPAPVTDEAQAAITDESGLGLLSSEGPM